MDFYRHQDHAKKLSFRILALFFMGLFLLSAGLSLVGLLLWQFTEQTHVIQTDSSLWHWYVVGNAVLFLTLILISVLKYTSLCRGGRIVAETLGARYVAASTTHPNERRLRNIVEEIGLAAGIPIPSIYILDDEPGINAFAAGMSINDAVIVVTQGAMTYLSRDELQGVVAHEFSHIVNGDIRLNQQLAALIGSLTFLGEVGRWLTNTSSSKRRYTTSSSKNSKGSTAIPLFGFFLILLGVIGTVWGKIMKAALNRQREFLADASAVQFTRYAAPLASALKKVGGFRYSSLVFHPQASTFGHLFFSQGLTENFRGWLATHPPLAERIKRLDPDWDGRYISAIQPVPEADQPPPHTLAVNHLSQEIQQHPELVGAVIASTGWFPQANAPQPEIKRVTPDCPLQPQPNDKVWVYDITSPSEWLPSIPEPLIEASRFACDARFLIYRLLISTQPETVAKQRALLGSTYASVKNLMKYPIPNGLQFALIELAIPALKEMTPAQFSEFHQQIWALIQADDQQSFTEWLTYRMINHQLQPFFGITTRTKSSLTKIEGLLPCLNVFLSYLAYLDNTDSTENRFAAYLKHPALNGLHLTLMPTPDLVQLDEALDQLQQASMSLRCHLLQIIIQAIESDGVIRQEEAGLFQMMAYCLDCPLPPPNIWTH